MSLRPEIAPCHVLRRGVPLVHVGGEKFENVVHGSVGARHVAFQFRTRRDHEVLLATCVESLVFFVSRKNGKMCAFCEAILHGHAVVRDVLNRTVYSTSTGGSAELAPSAAGARRVKAQLAAAGGHSLAPCRARGGMSLLR
ncbi:hypothetical protein NFJ02_39g99020 [Pycnococcus provasolii]